jgi:mannosyltransferase OCH1-like enzyme
LSVIPKVFHFIWVGDEGRRPNACFETWRRMNPGFDLRVWGNQELASYPWRTKKHMEAMWETRQLFGVADLMRWEILLNEGGFALDADSIAIEPLPEWFFGCTAFACWENELISPGLIANGYFACRPGDRLASHIVATFERQSQLAKKFVWYKLKYKTVAAWKSVGPKALTTAFQELQYNELTVFPSHFFCPRHLTSETYRGEGPVFCDQLFASSRPNGYAELKLHEATPEALIAMARARLNR